MCCSTLNVLLLIVEARGWLATDGAIPRRELNHLIRSVLPV